MFYSVLLFFDQISILYYVYDLTFANYPNNTVIIRNKSLTNHDACCRNLVET